MTFRQLAYLSWCVVISSCILSIWAGSHLSSGVTLPVQWGLNGLPLLLADKSTALMLPPGLLAANSLFFWLLPSIEPNRDALEQSRGLYTACWVGILLWHSTRAITTVATASGWTIASDRLNVASIGIALALVGDQLGNSRRMIVLGIVTPWTLASEEIWHRTHVLGGWLLVATGMLTYLGALVDLPPETLANLTALSILSLIVPTAYSFILSQR